MNEEDEENQNSRQQSQDHSVREQANTTQPLRGATTPMQLSDIFVTHPNSSYPLNEVNPMSVMNRCHTAANSSRAGLFGPSVKTSFMLHAKGNIRE
jgi:hypothetical protein